MQKPSKDIFTSRRSGSKRPVSIKVSQIQNKATRNKKMLMLIGGVLLLAIVVAGYLVYSTLRAKSIETDITSSQKAMVSHMKTFSASYAKQSTLERADSLEPLQKQTQPISCDGFSLGFPSLKEAIQRCSSHNSQLKTLQTSAQKLISLLRYDSSLNPVLNKALATNSDPSAGWKQKQSAWSTAVADVKKLNTPNELRKVQESLVSRLERLVNAWRALRKADEAKKLPEYKNAKATLGATYDTVRKSAEEYKAKYSTVQSEFVQAYRAAEKQ